MKKTTILMGLLAAAGLSPAVYADTFTWNLFGNDGGGSVGNVKTFNATTAGGPTVTATAWYVNSSGNMAKAALGQYSAGLGICNPSEGSASCGSPHHEVDNYGQLEFVLFEFSSPISNPVSFVIDPSPNSGASQYNGPGQTPDRDTSFYLGSPVLGANRLEGLTFASMSTLFANSNGDLDGSTGGGSLNVGLTSFGGTVNAVLFGALDTVNGGTVRDFFKIYSMTADTQRGGGGGEVPEPASLVLMGTAVLGVLGVARRKRNANPQA